jgi:hypothetical protein
MITIHNLETGEIIQRELNDDELAQKAKDEAAQLAFSQAQAEAAVKRQALLERLGITEEEAKLLLS